MKHIYIILFALSIISCEDVIDVKIDDDEPRLVVEAKISNQDGPHQVKLSMSKSYYSADPQEMVTDAIVSISDSDGFTDILTEIEDGVYSTNRLVGIIGNSYNLSIDVDGELYEAESTINAPIKIDSIRTEWVEYEFWEIEEEDDPTEGYRLTVYFNDPADVSNYERFFVMIGDEFHNGVFSYEDTYTDGNKVENIFYGLTSIEKGDTITVVAQAITKETMEFYNTSSSVIIDDAGGSSMGSAPPNNPNNNISNDALGYFSAYSVSFSEKIIVE